ncbi:MAG TPA: metallophosphoesterase [Polyangiaceae bacterium]|nr:metallophosphoesterase [Polyangiaceae bacterium]
MTARAALVAWVAFALVAACHAAPPEPKERPAAAAPAKAEIATPPSPGPPPDRSYVLPDAPRVVAIGDIHGDLAAARRALRLAGAIDAGGRWIGDHLVVVQTGDEIDRGDDDRAVLELFDALVDQASSRGGRVVALVGNHEAMNVAGDFRYVTERGFSSFADVDTSKIPGALLAQVPVVQRGRFAAFRPGGPMARRLASRPAIVQVGDTVFVHGGVTPAHVEYGISRLNRELSRWMNGEGREPAPATDPEGPLWTRRYSEDSSPPDCAGLSAALSALSAKRLVVGHTPHKEGIGSACGGAVWRIDTGLSAYYGGATEVLEIRGADVRVLETAPPAK